MEDHLYGKDTVQFESKTRCQSRHSLGFNCSIGDWKCSVHRYEHRPKYVSSYSKGKKNTN